MGLASPRGRKGGLSRAKNSVRTERIAVEPGAVTGVGKFLEGVGKNIHLRNGDIVKSVVA